MNGTVRVSRRDFLKLGGVAGAGLLLGFRLPVREAEAAEEQKPPYPPNAFLHIGQDSGVTIFVNKSEMGQGPYTAVAMLIAEELECDWNRVRVQPAPVAAVYNNPMSGMQMTGGSTTIRTEWVRMREVGAAARMMLIEAAAQNWKVSPATCHAENGKVVGRHGAWVSFGEIAEQASLLEVPAQVPLKDPSRFRLLGKPVPRLDTPAKVNGVALFGIDTQMPGMLVAVVERPPVYGGKMRRLEATRARAVPGVTAVFQIPQGVAVVARDFWAAKRGRDVLEVEWDDGPRAGLSTAAMRQHYRELAQAPGLVARRDGDPEGALNGAGKQVTVEYELPYLAHADMEPLNCAVDLRADGCDVWVGTQAQTGNQLAVARLTGLKPEQIRIHTAFLGGGFGRRGNPHSDFVVIATQVALGVRRPVKVIWTREDDMKGGYYRPLWHARMSAGLDEGGKVVSWQHRIVGQSIMKGTSNEKRRIKNGIDLSSVEGAKELPYEIPNVLVDLHSPEPGMPVQWWRSVGHSHTGFEVESFIDELAHHAGKDPYRFRHDLLARHPRHRGVLDLAAEKAGWGGKLAAGRGRGIAVFESYGSYVCEVAEVSVDRTGFVRVHRVVCAVDCGHTVNPGIIAAQMEGGIAFGLTAALYGMISVENGRVLQENFNDYPVLRMDMMPEVEVHIVKRSEKPGGIGETAVPPIAPAVTNAIFQLTGKRVRRLPIDPTFLKS
ncbi:xanthine dehydrogenase family protein molybdopterin-binding subunit [Geomesophilobacter sediminis]|uniref:Xanthine dehydrogenase family protein molybdopterin-binding subunit n=1 Tax=Geomesophilobacter sediminis TaxID=2798584 RepID=A0A8J7M3V3_9BACT|nr:xanthine dehydrogenase family protein molybdopterin-binding subunit [Geomesophilobacter sediminis]MBJ6727696.1 xanthine dehydrogenase family protein molybdopterin-binding subunit [Geomesophilobacter sediminis]